MPKGVSKAFIQGVHTQKDLPEKVVIEKINSIKENENIFLKIILEGSKNIEVNENELCKLTTNKNTLKIKDETKIKDNIDELAKQNNLKGIFVKKVLEKVKQGKIDEKVAKKVKKW